jgi:hypothetical protein
VISSLDAHADFVPFFVGLTMLGGINAWAVDDPPREARRWTAVGTALLWALAAVWFGVLLVFPFQASSPPPTPDQTFLGVPATVYRMVGLYGAAALIVLSTFAPERWVHRGRLPVNERL